MEAIDRIRHRVRWCESEGVDILCCPEAVLGGLADDAESPLDLAIGVGPELDALLAPVTSRAVALIVGFTERGKDDRLYNSAAVLQAGGVVGVYRKRHPAMRSSVYAAGEGMPIFKVGNALFGIMICNDSNHPSLAREFVRRGANLLFVPSNNALRPEKADVVAASRTADARIAAENGVVVVRADVAGSNQQRVSIGSSAITDSDGKMVGFSRPGMEDIVVAELRFTGTGSYVRHATQAVLGSA
jgi:predicted amidohydrolase